MIPTRYKTRWTVVLLFVDESTAEIYNISSLFGTWFGEEPEHTGTKVALIIAKALNLMIKN